MRLTVCVCVTSMNYTIHGQQNLSYCINWSMKGCAVEEPHPFPLLHQLSPIGNGGRRLNLTYVICASQLLFEVNAFPLQLGLLPLNHVQLSPQVR